MAQLDVKALKKIATRLALAGLVLLLALLASLVLFFDPLVQFVLGPVRAQINGDLRVGEAHLRLTGAVLEDVKMTTPDGQSVLEVDQVVLNARLGALLRGRWAESMRRIKLVNPGLRVVVDPGGSVNLTSLLPSDLRGDSGFLERFRAQVVFEDGYIIYRDERGAGFLYELSDWKGQIDFEPGQPIALDFGFRPLESAEGRFSLRGQVAMSPPRVHLLADVEQLELSPFSGHPGFGPGMTIIDSGTVTANLLLHSEAGLWDQIARHLFVLGEIRLAQVSFQSPAMPAPVDDLSGGLELVGSALRTEGLTGKVHGLDFKLWGEANFKPINRLNLSLTMPSIDLGEARKLLAKAPEATGQVALDATVEGAWDKPTIEGQLTGTDLTVEQEQVNRFTTRFRIEQDLLTLINLEADTSLGQLAGRGLAFLGDELGVALRLEGRNARLDQLAPGVARSGDFTVSVLGTEKNPLIYGQGNLSGLGAWSQGLTEARGRFMASRDTVIVYDGSASNTTSLVTLPFALYDPKTGELDGSVSTARFAWDQADGASAVVSGRASFWGNVEQPQSLRALGFITDGEVRYRDLRADELEGAFVASSEQLLLPGLRARVGQGTVELAGLYDLRSQVAELVVATQAVRLASLGLPGEGDLVAALSGNADGRASFHAALTGPQMTAVSQGFRRTDGQLGVSAWVQADTAEIGPFSARLAARGVPDNLAFAYNGELGGRHGLKGLDLFGEGALKGQILTLSRNLLTWENPFSQGFDLPVTRYQGHAYGFFGPTMAGPLTAIQVDSFPFPTFGSVQLSGRANLANGGLNLGIDASGIDLGWLASEPWFDGASFNEIAGFSLDSGLAFAYGRLGGTLRQPTLTALFDVPWLLVGDKDPDVPGLRSSYAYSMGARVQADARRLRLDDLLVSSRAFDPRIAKLLGETGSPLETALLRARGELALNREMELDLRLASNGWKASELALFLPGAISYLIPYGQVATDNFHIWGGLAHPSVAGTVALTDGGLWLSGNPLAIDSARLDFSGQQGEIRITDLTIESNGVALSGSGKRSRDGTLVGSLWAGQVPTSLFAPLGHPFDGLTGQLDVAVSVEGKGGRAPVIYLGLESDRLVWDPSVLTGEGSPMNLDGLVFGYIDRQNARPSTGPGQGVRLRLDGERVEVQIPASAFHVRLGEEAEAPELAAEGTVHFGLPASEQSLEDYFASPAGPDFGRGGLPFRFQAERLTRRALERVAGRPLTEGSILASGSLELEGQWYRDHQLGAGSGLPRYALHLDELRVEGENAGVVSGFRLEDPTQLRYQRDQTAGRLVLEPLTLAFFRLEQGPVSQTVGGRLEASGELALMEAAGANPDSHFQLAALSLPLENLAFLLPESLGLKGTIDQLEVQLDGPLLRPNLGVVGRLSQATLGSVHLAEGVLGIVGGNSPEGNYELTFTGPGGQPSQVYLGDKKSLDHSLGLKGKAQLDWLDSGQPHDDRLHLAWLGKRLSRTSRINAEATLTDKGMLLVAAVLGPGVKTAGEIEGTLSLEGSFEEPELAGVIEVKDASVLSREYGDLTELNIITHFDRVDAAEAEPSAIGRTLDGEVINRYAIERFEGRLGGQAFKLQGKAELIGLEPTYLDIRLFGDSLPIHIPHLFHGTATVDLAMQGVPGDDPDRPVLVPVIEGTVVIPEGDIEIPVSAVEGAEKRGSVAGAFPFLYDLDLNLGDDVWARALDSQVRARGELKVVNASGSSKPLLIGQLGLSRGNIRIPFYDASFRLRQGTAYWNRTLVPTLEAVEAVTDLGGYRIIARVDGTYPDNINVELFSDPPLPQAELSRLVVLGGLPTTFQDQQTANATSPQGFQGFLASQGVSFISGILTNRLTEGIGRALFLSEISFEYIPPADYVVKLAKALDRNDDFLLTLTRIIRSNSSYTENLFGIEWRFAQNLLVRTAFDELGQPRLWFQSISRF